MRVFFCLASLLFVLSSPAQTFLRQGSTSVGWTSTANGTNTRTFFSENRKFQVTIEGTNTGFHIEAQQRAILRAADKKGAPPLANWDYMGLNVGILWPDDVMIAADGASVVLPGHSGQWLVCRGTSAPVRLPESFFWNRPRAFNGEINSSLIEFDQLESDAILRVWHSGPDRWEALRVRSLQKLEVTPQLTELWNRATREKILKLLMLEKQDDLRRKLDAVSPKLSKLATNVAPVARGLVKPIHYEFLALRRNPADRPVFDAMVNSKLGESGPMPGLVRIVPSSNRNEAFPYALTDHERLRGDYFLSLFDRNLGGSAGASPIFLGKASGKVILPLPILRPRSGWLRIWLLPEGKGEAEGMEAELRRTSTDPQEAPDTISFQFGTVLPGKYFLKTIWDKRSAFEDWRQAGPGDYESKTIGPIEIAAGKFASGLVAICTNQVPTNAENYYAADGLTWKLWQSESIEAIVQRFPKATQATPDWIANTNASNKTSPDEIAYIGRAKAAQVYMSASVERPEEFVVIARRPRYPHPYPQFDVNSLRIIDGHGCEFAPREVHPMRQLVIYRFSAFPRSSASFRLVSSTGNDFTIKNWMKTDRREPSAKILPLEIPLKNVTLRIRAVGVEGNGWADTLFFEEGKPSYDWSVAEVLFADAEGNIAPASNLCRNEKVLRVIGRVINNLGKDSENFEFATARP